MQAITFHERLAQGLRRNGPGAVNALLVVLGVSLIVLALVPGHTLLKVAVAVWVIAP